MENESRNKEKKALISVKKIFSVFMVACGITIAMGLLFFPLLLIVISNETGWGLALSVFLGEGLVAISTIVFSTIFISGLFYAFRGRKSGIVTLVGIALLIIVFCVIFWTWIESLFWIMLG